MFKILEDLIKETFFPNMEITPFHLKIVLFAILCLIFCGMAFLISWILQKLMQRKFSGIIGPGKLNSSMKRPFFYIFLLTGLYISLKIFSFTPENAKNLYRFYFLLMVLLFLKGALGTVNFFCQRFRQRAQEANNVYSKLLVDLLQPAIKSVIWIIGILFILENIFSFKIGTLLASAGIASMAVAFAAQNTIANLFGAIALIVDRPFLAGDRIQVDGKDGIVQNIGLRCVRLISLDGTEISIPNKIMAESPILNMARRMFFRYTFVLNLTYAQSPEQLQKGKMLLKEILTQEPLIATSGKEPIISFDNFNESSLDLQVTFWIKTIQFNEFIQAKDRINMKILEKFNAAHIDFAFPSRSIYIEKMPEEKA